LYKYGGVKKRKSQVQVLATSTIPPIKALSSSVLLASLLLVASAALGQGAQVLIRAPIGCLAEQETCSNDVTLAAAMKSNENMIFGFAKCLADEKKSKDEIEQKRKQAEGQGIPNFPPALTLDSPYICKIVTVLQPECSDELSSAKTSGWAAVETITDGRAVIQDLQARASSGISVDGKIVVEALESKPGEQHLAFCNARTIKGAQGPPQHCQTVAIVTPSLTLVRARLLDIIKPLVCRTSATVRLSGAIDIAFEVQTKLDPTEFSNSIYRTLTEQLAFQSETDVFKDDRGKITNISIRSTAPYRESPILKNGWRESIDFDVDIAVNDKGIEVRAYSKPMVCRQAAGQSIEYHGPDDAQKATYASVLNGYVGQAITKACIRYTQIDSRRIECQ
jgi:hypothetical protein